MPCSGDEWSEIWDISSQDHGAHKSTSNTLTTIHLTRLLRGKINCSKTETACWGLLHRCEPARTPEDPQIMKRAGDGSFPDNTTDVCRSASCQASRTKSSGKGPFSCHACRHDVGPGTFWQEFVRVKSSSCSFPVPLLITRFSHHLHIFRYSTFSPQPERPAAPS